MKKYIAGKITGQPNYMELFEAKQTELEAQGHAVINPAKLINILGTDFTHREYMHICFSLIDLCDEIHFFNNWIDSFGAKLEMGYALWKGKTVVVE